VTGFWAAAAAGAAAHLEVDGAGLGLVWVAPFAGMLLSIALMPLLTPKFWHHHFGKVAGGWALTFLVPYAVLFGFDHALHAFLHTLLLEYIPFILLLFALFVVAGGIFVSGNLRGTPASNTGLLAFGTMAASVLGTTGASMLLIRPTIRANAGRPYNVHVFVFFIFLVSNIGGSLTPLGDPPLYLGFLKGVDFFWTAEHLLLPMLTSSAILLGVFYALDTILWRREGRAQGGGPRNPEIRIQGLVNVLLLLAIILVVLFSNRIEGTLGIWGIPVSFADMARAGAFAAIAAISIALTPPAIRVENAFSWEPMQEVALLFGGIFVTMIPALAILRAGEDGALASLVALTSHPDGSPNNAMYFWLTGSLSSFLDNAPTYLVFFNLAGGGLPEAQIADHLMTALPGTLAAISAGAVFMGANSYIGNAPNFMVKSICEERGVKMPSFFGYMAWSVAILIPVFVLNTVLFFH
jgi:Na+/H+ antiporter NhaD/arsenite permease-like protein